MERMLNWYKWIDLKFKIYDWYNNWHRNKRAYDFELERNEILCAYHAFFQRWRNRKSGKLKKWLERNGLPNSALIKGESFFLGCRVTGGGDGEQGGVGKLEALVMSSDCNHERLVNSASTSQSSLCIFSFILGESRFIRFSTSIDSPFIFTIFHRISIERTMLRI